jgi:Protein of unknown function (DUF3047)
MSAATLPKCAPSNSLSGWRGWRAVAVWVAAATVGPLAAQQPPSAYAPPKTIIVGDFAGAPAGTLPAEWRALTFPDIKTHTLYAAVPDPAQGQAVKATASASASGLLRKIALDAHAYPILRWRWKADNLISKGDVTRKEGDDYPARIYVSFAYDPQRVSLLERARYGAARLIYGEYPPHAGLNYIWDGKAPVGTLVTNAFTSRVKMIVVESGPSRLHEWLTYERNILEDYRRAFGEEPPPVSGIAIMTDADNTGESAVAWYGNIELQPAPQ